MLDISTDPIRGRVQQVSADRFEAPKTIIKSVAAARGVYATLRANHLKRIGLYTEIESLIAGNPPYDPGELASAGLQHIANFNDMSACGVIERACLAYWNLLHNTETLVTFTLRIPGAKESTKDWAAVMSRNWDEVIRTKWRSFMINVASLSTQLIKFGISPILFPDERDPRFRVIELSKFYIPDQAQSDLDLLTNLCVESEFTVQYLWDVYQEHKDKDAGYQSYIAGHNAKSGVRDATDSTPWNIIEIGKLLVFMSGAMKDANSPTDTLELERKLFSGDITFDNLYSDSVKVVSLFQKEYSGKISHYMFHRFYDGGNFLFFQWEQYKCMDEALVIFTMNPGHYTIHSNRGVGHKIYSLASAKTQLDCSVVDMAKYASTPIIKSSSLSTKDSDQIRFYPGVMTNIGSAEFVENNLGGNVQGVVTAAEYLNSLIQFNITYSGSDSAQPDPDVGSLSPSQTRISAFREFSVLKNNIMHFYATFDCVLQNMVAKMLRSKEGYPGYDIAEEWINRCIEDGVPEIVFSMVKDDDGKWGLPKHIGVKATRAAGAGSQIAHLIGLQELQPIIGSFGQKAQESYTKDMISATIGPEYVEAYTQDMDDMDEQAGGASLAGTENAIMQMGKMPVFSRDNEHRAHFSTHMALNSQIMQQVQQGQMDVIQADSVMNLSVPHTGQHFEVIAQNPFTQDFFQKAKPSFEQVIKWTALNRKNAEKSMKAKQEQQQQDAQSQQQVMNEDERKNFQLQQDNKRADFKVKTQAQRQLEAAAVKQDVLEKKTAGELEIKKMEALGKHKIEASKANGTPVAPLYSLPIDLARPKPSVLAGGNGSDL